MKLDASRELMEMAFSRPDPRTPRPFLSHHLNPVIRGVCVELGSVPRRCTRKSYIGFGDDTSLDRYLRICIVQCTLVYKM